MLVCHGPAAVTAGHGHRSLFSVGDSDSRMSSRSDADRPPGRSRLVATVILAVAACGLCAAVVGSQDERGHNARLELESADANLIRVLDHSGSGNVHNQGEPAKNAAE